MNVKSFEIDGVVKLPQKGAQLQIEVLLGMRKDRPDTARSFALANHVL
jgi:hypothetical protein